MQYPKVSVILPVYNGEPYLRNCLESVLNQTYENFELIICDDCSKDESVSIIQSYNNARIKLIKNNPNQGLFSTLNRLIDASSSEYLRLWSQDDIMYLDCLEKEIAFHQQHPELGMSYCMRDIINERGEIVNKAFKDNTPEIVSSELANQISFYHGSMTGNIANVMLKKSVLSDVGLFREDMKVSGDFEMWVRIMDKYPIGCIHKTLIKLRNHTGQFSRRKGINFVFMKEDREIYDTLIKRLPPELLNYAQEYMRLNLYTQYVNYIFHCLISGDLTTAVKIFQEISKFDNVFAITWLFLITGNRRFWKKQPKFLLTSQT